jgi:predicted ATPase
MTPKQFPYISQIKVVDCFAYQNFLIPGTPLVDIKHIILTGKNGSGKTTILRGIADQILQLQTGTKPTILIEQLKAAKKQNPQNYSANVSWDQQITDLEAIELVFSNEQELIEFPKIDQYIFSYFKAHRKVAVQNVTTVTRETDFTTNIKQHKSDPGYLASQFKQYLVNKKIYEAFDFMNSKMDSTSQNKIFFEELTGIFRKIFGDGKLKLEFVQEVFEFYIVFSDSRKVTFNQLSEGFSAFLNIVMDLIMRVDLIRRQSNNLKLDPTGIVLIDEPETHFHLSMQYEILPLLSKLFPNLQLIIATHSPAVISSLKNAIVYDISSQTEVSDWLLGSSYSELMIKHFGLENEFSPIADKILSDIEFAVLNNNVLALKNVIIDNEKYLTPSLRLEIESQISKIESQKKA